MTDYGKEEELCSGGVSKTLSLSDEADHALQSMKVYLSCRKYLTNSWEHVLYACSDGPCGER